MRRYSVPIVIFLALVFTALAVSSLSIKSPVCDESAHHVPVGYVFLKTGDFTFATDSPVLARYIGAFPLLFMNVQLPLERTFWARDDRAEFSREFLYSLNRNISERIIFMARLPMVLLAVFGGLYLFFWVRKNYDEVTALFAAFFYFLSPNILAHARFATTDIGAAVFIMCSVLSFWSFLKSFGNKEAVISGVFLGLALMTKYSALLLLPAYLITLIVKGKGRGFAVFFLVLAVSFIVLWAGYAFEFKPFLQGVLREGPKVELFRSIITQINPSASEETIENYVQYLYTMPIPLSSYLLGVIGVLKHGAEGAATYFLGEWGSKGNPLYYLVGFLIKTPLPVIISFVAGTVLTLRKEKLRPLGLYLLFIIFLFAIMASRANLQIGMRYLLPVYPLVFIIASIFIVELFRSKLIYKVIGAALIVWSILVQILIWPHYLSYFNEFAGGPDNGWKYLRDSNIDWGQDLKAVKGYMQENDVDEITLSYYGEADPSLYNIDFRHIPPEEVKTPSKTAYAVSVQNLDNVKWTRDYEPTEKAGYSIFIYDFRASQAKK